MVFKNLKISTKQTLGFGLVLLVMAAVIVFSISKMAAIKSEIDEVTQNWLPRAIAVADLNVNTSNLRIDQLQLALTHDANAKRKLVANMVDLIDKINQNHDTYERLMHESKRKHLYSEAERNLYVAFDRKWEKYQDLSFTFFTHLQNGENTQAAHLIVNEANAIFSAFSTDLAGMVRLNHLESLDAAIRSEKAFKTASRITTLLLVLTVSLSAILATGLIRHISIAIGQLESAAWRVAEGNLSVQLDISGRDEIGNLAHSFNRMTQSLRDAKAKAGEQEAKLRAQQHVLQQQNDELNRKSQDLQRTLEELKSTQEQLLMREKMAALGDLVAGIAHEINNPIGTVNASADVSLRCLARLEMAMASTGNKNRPANGQAVQKPLRILRDSLAVTLAAGSRVAEIVKSLKNFARLDESEYKISDVHEGIDSTLTLLNKELQERIQVIKNYGALPKIACFPGQLNQVFLNLLKNAAAAIPDAGSITISTAMREKQVTISISDTGVGIPEERLSKLFNFTFSDSGSRVKMGSGLSAVYNIIQNHHGTIDVASAPGEGTTFTIVLPIEEGRS